MPSQITHELLASLAAKRQLDQGDFHDRFDALLRSPGTFSPNISPKSLALFYRCVPRSRYGRHTERRAVGVDGQGALSLFF